MFIGPSRTGQIPPMKYLHCETGTGKEFFLPGTHCPRRSNDKLRRMMLYPSAQVARIIHASVMAGPGSAGFVILMLTYLRGPIFHGSFDHLMTLGLAMDCLRLLQVTRDRETGIDAEND